MKEEKQLLNDLKNLISRETGVNLEEIMLNSHFEDDLNIASFEFANLMVTVEEEFNVEIPPEDIEKIKIVQDLLHAVEDNQ
ncbi:MAG: acyl carrier protein [bacterium]